MNKLVIKGGKKQTRAAWGSLPLLACARAWLHTISPKWRACSRATHASKVIDQQLLQLYFHKYWILYDGMLKLNDVERKQEWAPFRSTRMTMEARTSTKMSLRSIKLHCVYFASINFSNVGQFSWSLILNDSIKSSSERETNIHFPHKSSYQEFSCLKVRSHGWPEEFLTGWKFVRLGVPS